MFKKSIPGLFALVFAFTGTGCLMSRTIRSVEDHPTRSVTLIETVDNYWFTTHNRYWLCQEDASKLSCQRTCDAKAKPGTTKRSCVTYTFGGYSNLY